MSKQLKVGLFGGAFDPIHNSHIDTAKEALKSGLDEVWLIPSFNDPRHKEIQTPYEHRLELAHIATKSLSNIKVSTIESTLNRSIVHSIDYIKRLIELKDYQFSLIMGTDTYLTFEHWKDFHTIRQLVPDILVAKRSVDPIDLRDIAITFGLNVKEIYPPINLMSSSKVRMMLKHINYDVLEYIIKKDLY